jgi:serine/threonine protein kinase/tetratricopeptide (TPR) repeat protein
MDELINGRYRLEQSLGRGGMGEVYRALDRLTGQTVALKRVLQDSKLTGGYTSHGGGSQGKQMAIAREFRILTRLRHPHIISVLDYGFDADRVPFFTMELLGDALHLLDYARDKPQEQKLGLLLQLLEALDYLHRWNFVHRDLKPSNILVTPQGQLKVMDFGLAVEKGEPAESAGTYNYLSPEVLSGAVPGPTADLFAVGVLACQMIFGRHPFASQSIMGVLDRILYAPPDLSDVQASPESEADSFLEDGTPLVIHSQVQAIKDVSPQALAKESPKPSGLLEAWIYKLLEKDPRQRYPSAKAAAQALRQAVDLPLPPNKTAQHQILLQGPPFVGREVELEQLRLALGAAQAGRGACYLIGGESGLGKSRLVEELSIYAQLAGSAVLRGQMVEGNRAPYVLWSQVIPQLALLVDISPLEGAILQEVAPRLSVLVPNLPESPLLGERDAAMRLRLALGDVLGRLDRFALVILEDLHWGDEDLAPLQDLIPHITGRPLLVIGTYRHDERPQLPQSLPGARVILLERFQGDQIRHFGQAILGDKPVSADFARWLERETEGNTFFMVEVFRALAQEAGDLDTISMTTLPEAVVTGGMEQVIQRRLARVPAEYLGPLQLAAIWGRQLDLQLLARLYPHLDQGAWLYTCTAAAVLEAQGAGWWFAHDKLRESLLAMIPAHLRPGMYRQVAEAIEAIYPGRADLYLPLANFWRVAGQSESELRYLILGTEHLSLVNITQGLALMERALAIATLHPQAESMAAIYTRLAGLYQHLGEGAKAIEYNQVAVQQARQSGQAALLAEALSIELALAVFNAGDWERAKAMLPEVSDYCRQSHKLSRLCRVLCYVGVALTYAGDSINGKPYFQESLALSRQIADPYAESYALTMLGLMYQFDKDFVASREHFRQSEAISRPLNDDFGLLLIYLNWATMALEGNFIEELSHYAPLALKQALRTGRSAYALIAIITWLDILVNRDQADTALEWFAFVKTHPHVGLEAKQFFPHFEEIVEGFPPERFALAEEKAKQWTFESICEQILTELPQE